MIQIGMIREVLEMDLKCIHNARVSVVLAGLFIFLFSTCQCQYSSKEVYLKVTIYKKDS